MARPGINKVQMRQALASLEKKGVKPSLRTLHAELGGGSFTTIGNVWREVQTEDKETYGEGGRVHDQLTELVTALHDELQERANSTVEAGAAEAAKEVASIKDALGKEQEAHAKTIQALAAREVELAKADGLNMDLIEKLNQANAAIGDQAQELTGLQESKKEIEKAASHYQREAERANDNLAHYQEHMSTLRKQDMQNHEREVTGLRTDISELRNAVSAKTSEAGQMARDNQRLTTELVSQANTLRKVEEDVRHKQGEIEALTQTTSELHVTAAGTKARAELLLEQLSQSQAELRSTEDRLNIATTETNTLKGQVANLEAKLAAQMPKSSVEVQSKE